MGKAPSLPRRSRSAGGACGASPIPVGYIQGTNPCSKRSPLYFSRQPQSSLEVEVFLLAGRCQEAIGRARKLGLPHSFLVMPTRSSRTTSLAVVGKWRWG